MKWSSPMSLAIGLVIGLSVGLMLTPLIASENDAKIAMWLEVVQRVCTSVGGLGTCVALIIVIQQFTLLRTQSELSAKEYEGIHGWSALRQARFIQQVHC